MTTPIKIDFVSDVACPWCAIGLKGLEEAIARVGDLVQAEVHFQPFELNPDMPPGGQDAEAHLREKYGAMTPEQLAQGRETIQARARALGFAINRGKGSRIHNTFDAHRLLHWAGLKGRQHELKSALLAAYHSEGLNPEDPDVLADASAKAGLDPAEARDVLSSGRYTDEVRRAEMFWRRQGIQAVPSIVFNDKFLLTGGYPPEDFEKALRMIVEQEAAGEAQAS